MVSIPWGTLRSYQIWLGSDLIVVDLTLWWREGPIQVDSKRHYFAVAALFCAGVVLRVIAAGREALWADEALTLMISLRSVGELLITPVDPTPGLYYILHKALIGPHAGVVAMRSISLVSGSLVPLATYALGRLAGGRSVGLASMALTVLSFSLIDSSQEARAYSLLVLLVTLSAASFLWWARSNSALALGCFATTLVLSTYAHFVSIFWVVPISIGALVMRRSGKLAVALGVACLFTAPEIARLLTYPRNEFSWLSQLPGKDAIGEIGHTFFPFAPAWPVTALLIGALICFGARQRWSPEAALALGILLFAPLLVWLFGFVVKPIFMWRTIFIAIPAFAVALSLSFKGQPWSMGAIVAAYALNLVVTGTARQKTDWTSAATSLGNVRPDDVVVLCPAWEAAAFRHAVHVRIPAPLLVTWPKGTTMMEPALGSNPDWVRVYFAKQAMPAEAWRRAFKDGRERLALARRVWRVRHEPQCAISEGLSSAAGGTR